MEERDDRRRTFGRRSHLTSTYEIVCEAGQGMYGVVSKARHLEKNTYYAIKEFKPNSQPNKESDGVSFSSCREIMLLRELSHRNVVRLEEIVLSPEDEMAISLVFDYAEYDLGSMLEWHRSVKRPLSDLAIKSILFQLLHGVQYLHANWVLHRDLKPQNILVMGVGPEKGTVKIADFGLARLFRSPLRPLHDDGEVVTIWYRAPELLLRSRHYTRAVDMWAVGCIFGELIMSCAMFPGKKVDDQVGCIFKVLGTPSVETWPSGPELPDWDRLVGNAPHQPRILQQYVQQPRNKMYPAAVSANAFDLLHRLLAYDPVERITAAEALQHPYFNELPAPSENAFDEYGAEPPYPKRSAKPPPVQRQQSRSDSRRRPPSQTYTGKRKGPPQ